MSRGLVPRGRIWFTLLCLLCAAGLLLTGILTGSKDRNTVSNSISVPEDLPDIYIVSQAQDEIVIRNPYTRKVLYSFGEATDFDIQAGHIIIQHGRTWRVIELTTGKIRWEDRLDEPFSLFAGQFIRPQLNQFVVVEYVEPLNSQLRFTIYELDSQIILDQQFIEQPDIYTIVPDLSSAGDVVMHTQNEIVRYNLQTKQHITEVLPLDPEHYIFQIRKDPKADRWFGIDQYLALYSFSFAADSNQLVTEEISSAKTRWPINSDLGGFYPHNFVVTPKGVYLAYVIDREQRQDNRNRVIYHYDPVTGLSKELRLKYPREISGDMIGGGIWIRGSDQLIYWDGDAVDPEIIELSPFSSFAQGYFFSILPKLPPHPLEPVPSSGFQLPKSVLQAEPRPFVWTGTYQDSPSNYYTYHAVETLTLDGSQTLLNTHVVASFIRPGIRPLLLMKKHSGFVLFDPEKNTSFIIKDVIKSGAHLYGGGWTLYPHEWTYLFSPNQDAIVWVSDTTPQDNTKGEYLVVTDIATGKQHRYPIHITTDEQFPYIKIFGWNKTNIYFAYGESQIWQLNTIDGTITSILQTEAKFSNIAFDPLKQRLVYLSIDYNPDTTNRFRMYDLQTKQNTELMQMSWISNISFAPTNGFMSWLAFDESEARLMYEDASGKIHVLYQTLNPYMLSLPSEYTSLWYDDHSIHILEHEPYIRKLHAPPYRPNLAHYVEINVPNRTRSTQLTTMPFIYKSSKATVMYDVLNSDDSGQIFGSILRISHSSTEPDVVITFSEKEIFSDILYIFE